MANARIGSHPSHGFQVAETIDTTSKQLTWNDSGKVFMCVQNGTADVEVYLPKLSTEIAGWHAKFILKTAAANDFFITAFGSAAAGSTSSDSDTIMMQAVFQNEDDAGLFASAADTVQFVGGASEAGNTVEISTDGTSWYGFGWARQVEDILAPN